MREDGNLKRTYELGVIHGRFQVLHKDHLKYLLAGLRLCNHLVIGVTNPDPLLSREEDADPIRGRSESNPLTYYERYVMLRRAMEEAGVPAEDFSVVPFPVNMPELYPYYVPMEAVFFLTIYDDWGKRKREIFEVLGLNIHVLWEVPLERKGISGKDVRALMVEEGPWQALVPTSVRSLMEQWRIPDRLGRAAKNSDPSEIRRPSSG